MTCLWPSLRTKTSKPSWGHIVYHVAEQSAGATVEKVLELARKTDSVLITTDKDFGEMVFRQRKLVPGVIRERAEQVVKTVERCGDDLRGAFTVITTRAVRIRIMP